MGVVRLPFRRAYPWMAATDVASGFDSHELARRAAVICTSPVKRVSDIVISALLLVLCAPLLALVAIAVVLDSGFPILFGQKRVSVDRRKGSRRDPVGRTFTCWKFRTMVTNAEALRESYLALNVAPFPAFKIPCDPRVTRVGRFLRRSSIDELPQLWNVLRGEMSLVGPRPPLPQEARTYDEFALQRLTVRPGLTCLWQLDRRHECRISFREWVEKDLEYIRDWSVLRDFMLLLRTAKAVLLLTGD